MFYSEEYVYFLLDKLLLILMYCTVCQKNKFVYLKIVSECFVKLVYTLKLKITVLRIVSLGC